MSRISGSNEDLPELGSGEQTWPGHAAPEGPGPGPPAPKPTLAQKEAKRIRRNRLLIAGAVAGAVAGVLGGGTCIALKSCEGSGGDYLGETPEAIFERAKQEEQKLMQRREEAKWKAEAEKAKEDGPTVPSSESNPQ